MAVGRVERRLKRVTAALNAAGIRYAVIGGNAVAYWVAKKDPSAVRSTIDVDLMINRSDLASATQSLEALGFTAHDLRRMVLFTDPEEPSKHSGIHLVWAGEKVRSNYDHAAPRLDEAIYDSEQHYWVMSLPALVRMKLTSNRDVDRTHIGDLIRVGAIDAQVRDSLPIDLLQRLDEIEKQARENWLEDEFDE